MTGKNSPNVDKKLPKNDSTIKMKYFDIFLQKLPVNMGELGKIIITTGFEKLPKVQ